MSTGGFFPSPSEAAQARPWEEGKRVLWLRLRFGTLDVRAQLPVLSVSMRLQANHVTCFPNYVVALGALCHSILGLHPLTGIKQMIFTLLI